MAKLFDCFSLWNEGELLDLRLHHLYSVVDKFVIVEGDHTFAGKPIDSFLKKNWDKYKWASSKIKHIIVPLKAKPKDSWENEATQRDGYDLSDADPEDLVLIGCVDEIPKVEMLEKLKKSKDNILTMLELENFYYYFNSKDVGESAGFPCPVLTRKKNITEGTHKLWGNRYSYPITKNAGWHFSYMGGAEKIVDKLNSASHQEFNTDYHKDLRRIKFAIKNGDDLFDRDDHKFKVVPIDESFPLYLQQNQEKFKHLIL